MGCGKGEIVNILQKKGFEYITLSSMVREEARFRGIPEEREKLMEVGNSMRAEGGVGILAKKALQKIVSSAQDKWVIDGIRNPAEIDELKLNNDKVYIVGVNTDKNLLVDRIVKRARESDARTREDILRKIEREWGAGEPMSGQQVGKCMEKVDYVIENNGTLDDLSRNFLAYYQQIEHNDGRPSKDQYYLDLARSVCSRGTCTKVEIGAVIIKDDQVVATGYVGAPRGTKSSLQHGFCLRKRLGIPSGHRYEMCRSVHAEQNAIINAARSGVGLLGGDMYIYGKSKESGEMIDAFPCFICKKMLINCGLKRVICSLKNGEYIVFSVQDWIDEWAKNDIVDDKFQYGEATRVK